MHNFRQLSIWKDAIEFAVVIYNISSQLPDTERFGLQTQMNKASVSIPSNIAEGCGRSSNRSFAYFLSIALGSAYELETQLTICKMLGFISSEIFTKHANAIQSLQRRIKALRDKYEG